jgi:hypothetical protein
VNTDDPRVERARAYLASHAQPARQLPPSALMQQLEDTRRHLAAVLAVIRDDSGEAILAALAAIGDRQEQTLSQLRQALAVIPDSGEPWTRQARKWVARAVDDIEFEQELARRSAR